MSWDKAKQFGVVKFRKNIVNLYYTKDNYETITLPSELLVKNAMWTGDGVIIYLENGKVRLYKSKSSYTSI